MSLTADVINEIERRGSGTVDDILPALPGYSRLQVRSALQWAALHRADSLRRPAPEKGPCRAWRIAAGDVPGQAAPDCGERFRPGGAMNRQWPFPARTPEPTQEPKEQK